MRRALLGVVAALVLVAAGTYLAGEQTEVVVLRTRDAAGAAHDTKMWIVDALGSPFVRVANPQRGWYQRLLAEPRVELVRAGRTLAMTAHPEEAPAVREAVDAAFTAKYGLVDAWYGLLLRRSPMPVRLAPEQP
jgi:uncharacterized protein DUF2255